MKKTMMFLIALAIPMAMSQAAKADTKIGYVDVQKAVQATSSGKKAKESMEAEYNKRKKELDKKKADIEKMGQDLEKKKSVLSEEVFNKKQVELQEEMMKFQKNVAENQMEIQKKEKDLVDPILEKMKGVIEKVAKDKGYTMVFEKTAQNILYSQPDADLTDTVVKEFEKGK